MTPSLGQRMIMLALPPPISQRSLMIAAAYRRGVPKTVIARSLATSHQYVDQTISRYEKYHGKILTGKRLTRSLSINFKQCTQCRKPFKAMSVGMLFCSSKCVSDSQRLMPDVTIQEIIKQRKCLTSWKQLAKIHNTSAQVIQRSIWRYLVETNSLTISEVSMIWMPSPTCQHINGRWNWLINMSGVKPSL